ncbi:MAG: hypothetical protein J0I36_20355, partial [Pandoraea sp.]|nr:hypothetical protein [Pandoraea sp.]
MSGVRCGRLRQAGDVPDCDYRRIARDGKHDAILDETVSERIKIPACRDDGATARRPMLDSHGGDVGASGLPSGVGRGRWLGESSAFHPSETKHPGAMAG